MVFKPLNQTLLWWQFLLWKNFSALEIIYFYYTKAGPHICPYLMERMMALQKMIDKKNTYRLFSPFFQFLPGVNCVSGALMIVPSQTKFVKSRQTIGICWAPWWQKVCLIKQRFNYADRPSSRKIAKKCYGEKSLIKLIWYLLHNSTGAFCVWAHALSYCFRAWRELT